MTTPTLASSSPPPASSTVGLNLPVTEDHPLFPVDVMPRIKLPISRRQSQKAKDG